MVPTVNTPDTWGGGCGPRRDSAATWEARTFNMACVCTVHSRDLSLTSRKCGVRWVSDGKYKEGNYKEVKKQVKHTAFTRLKSRRQDSATRFLLSPAISPVTSVIYISESSPQQLTTSV